MVQALFDLGGVEVWELSSRPCVPLRRSDAPHLVMAEFGPTPGRSVLLHLRVIDAAPPVKIERFIRSADRFGPDTWVERSAATGLIQLFLQDLASPLATGNPGNSHTNHMTEKGHFGRTGQSGADCGVNFAAVARFSAALNRRIRKLAAAKIGGLVRLPGAYGLWRQGVPLQRGETFATHPDLVQPIA